MSCSSPARRMKGLKEHLLYPFTVRMEEHGTTSSASLRANCFSLKGSPFHYTTISRPQPLKSKRNAYPPPRRSSPSAPGHCSYCSLSGLCFPSSLVFPQQAMAQSLLPHSPPLPKPQLSIPPRPAPGYASAPESIFP